MNYLWGGMILIGVVYGAFSGNMQEVTEAVVVSSREAVSLCISMAGVLALWSGLMRIAEDSGLIASLARGMDGFISFLFPNIPRDHPSRRYLSTNILSNIMGLGWAATPAGLKAMESLAELEEERRADSGNTARPAGSPRCRRVPAAPPGTASDEMCTFLILNISSLQLIPVNIIAYRSQYGSVDPTAIVGPAIAATAVSTLVAIVFCRVMERKKRTLVFSLSDSLKH